MGFGRADLRKSYAHILLTAAGASIYVLHTINRLRYGPREQRDSAMLLRFLWVEPLSVYIHTDFPPAFPPDIYLASGV